MEVDKIRESLPPGVQIEPFYDQSQLVTDSIKSVRDAILVGVLFASCHFSSSFCTIGEPRLSPDW